MIETAVFEQGLEYYFCTNTACEALGHLFRYQAASSRANAVCRCGRPMSRAVTVAVLRSTGMIALQIEPDIPNHDGYEPEHDPDV